MKQEVNDNESLSLSERHEKILSMLNEKGSVSVMKLANYFGVSEVTIRKDLSTLEQQNRLYRTHGSAIPVSPYIGNRHINEKKKRNVSEKRAIGVAAARLIIEEDSIILGPGTTISAFAQELSPIGKLTVITSSTPVTTILSQDGNINVYQLGGMTRCSSMSVVGPFAEEMLTHFNCSKLFIGVDGIDMESGITTTDTLEASLHRKMISAAEKVIVLADSSKFGRRGLSKICGLDEVDLIITDSGVQPSFLEQLAERNVEVIVVE